jgi:hypothetical protein
MSSINLCAYTRCRNGLFCNITLYARASAHLNWVALRVRWNVCVSVSWHRWGCGTLTILASPWVDPYNPNVIPIILPGTNAVDAAQIARMHDEFCLIYPNIINVDQTLNQTILEAYDNMYTSQLEDYLFH